MILSRAPWIGPALVGLAAILWSTDALVRVPAIDSVSPTFIVFSEHLLAVLCLLPWVLSKHHQRWLRLDRAEWLSAAFVGIGGSAAATVMFTQSFRYVNPSVAILLQKLQPVIVVALAFAFLGERPRRGFYPWAGLALVCGLLLSFPGLDFAFLSNAEDLHARGVFFSLGAAALWAVSTVVGKRLLKRQPPSVATFWRFVFGLVALGLFEAFVAGDVTTSFTRAWGYTPIFLALLYMAIVPGLVAMVAYYAGLERTPASVSTIVELLFPIGAVILNTLFLDTPLDTTQVLAGVGLLFAVTMISVPPRKR